MKDILLNDGRKIPEIGFGTYKTTTGGVQDVIPEAIRAGYRHIDTASYYGNEEAVGDAWSGSGIDRGKFFITTKLWKTEMGYAETKRAAEESLRRLRTDYIDLYLIHWPRPTMDADWRTLDLETWRAMEELVKEGKVLSIGVSNFLPHHLENIISGGSIMPVVDQIEFHPGYMQKDVLAYCRERGILVEAWSPLGRGRVFEDELLNGLAAKYSVSLAQLCKRFAMQEGVLPLPKSSSMQRMLENMDVFGFEIDDDDIGAIEAMPETGFSGYHPDKE